MNGLDFDEWDPSTDPRLCPGAQYTAASVKQGKAAAKAWFQQQHGLAVDPDVPLVAFVGRLAHQKGADVILAAAPAILNPRPMPKPGGGEARRRPRLQLVMLGEGRLEARQLTGTQPTKLLCLSQLLRLCVCCLLQCKLQKA